MHFYSDVVMRLHPQKGFSKLFCSNYAEISFKDRRDFDEVKRFLEDIKHSVDDAVVEYQWKFDVFASQKDLTIRIIDGKGIERQTGIAQCIDWFRGNQIPIRIIDPSVTERSSLLAPPPSPAAPASPN